MPINKEMRAALARMERARDDTLRQLDIIHRQIAVRAKRMAVSFRAKARQLERRKGAWTLADERRYCENLSVLHFDRRPEIDVLARTLLRRCNHGCTAIESGVSYHITTFLVDRGLRSLETLTVQFQGNPNRRKAGGRSEGGGS